MREYRIEEGSIHEQFLASTAKIQVFGGGFGNGKTAAACIKAIQLIRDYPGCNGLIARATFPKLNDTIRKEFKLWCPPSLIRSFPESKNSDNTAKFENGSQINFRYVSQQGKQMEATTSNLLSATYDWIIVDQMEDPEITEKDFNDLLGRLRGNTVYRGLDPRMPKSGPRFMMLTVNPTANWFFKRIVRPLKVYQESGKITDDLLCERDEQGLPIIVNGKPILLVELYEAPTYANRRNLGADFIKTLESVYRGQMRDRFLMGKWASYEGLIYPEYDATVNGISARSMSAYLDSLVIHNYHPTWIEGYDFGIASPSCYLLGFVDPQARVHVIDGFYEKEMSLKRQAAEINRIRARWGVGDLFIQADPSIFKRTGVGSKTVGTPTSELLYDEGRIRTTRANNDILNGIVKVKSYITVQLGVQNPYTGELNAPMMYFSDALHFIDDEITAYMWAKDNAGTPLDKPVDKNDHAMDTLRYILTERPEIGRMLIEQNRIPAWMQWHEREIVENVRRARHG